MIGKMAIAKALRGFNDLGHLVTPTDFIYKDLHIVQERTKTERGKLKKFQDFCPRDIDSCHILTARCVKLWSLNSNLFFKEPHQLTKSTCDIVLHLCNACLG